MPNADTNTNKIFNTIINHAGNKIKKFKSIEYEDFVSLMKYSIFIIGNSSSGIIEAPSMKIPTINVGRRQHGRLRANSIIDSTYKITDIKNSIKRAMSKNFQKN